MTYFQLNSIAPNSMIDIEYIKVNFIQLKLFKDCRKKKEIESEP